MRVVCSPVGGHRSFEIDWPGGLRVPVAGEQIEHRNGSFKIMGVSFDCLDLRISGPVAYLEVVKL